MLNILGCIYARQLLGLTRESIAPQKEDKNYNNKIIMIEKAKTNITKHSSSIFFFYMNYLRYLGLTFGDIYINAGELEDEIFFKMQSIIKDYGAIAKKKPKHYGGSYCLDTQSGKWSVQLFIPDIVRIRKKVSTEEEAGLTLNYLRIIYKRQLQQYLQQFSVEPFFNEFNNYLKTKGFSPTKISLQDKRYIPDPTGRVITTEEYHDQIIDRVKLFLKYDENRIPKELVKKLESSDTKTFKFNNLFLFLEKSGINIDDVFVYPSEPRTEPEFENVSCKVKLHML